MSYGDCRSLATQALGNIKYWQCQEKPQGRCILCFFWPPFAKLPYMHSYLWQTKETYGRVKIPFGPIKQIISHWFQLPGAALEWPPITRQGKRYKTAKTMSTHWHHCSLTTWLFIPHLTGVLDHRNLFNFPNSYLVLGVCSQSAEPNAKRADLIDKLCLSGRPARQSVK